MNPRAELRQLIQRLENEIHDIKATPANTLRISDRRRELARCTMLLARMEHRDSPTWKVRTVPFDGTAQFPPFDEGPDDFGGVAQENLPVFPDLVGDLL